MVCEIVLSQSACEILVSNTVQDGAAYTSEWSQTFEEDGQEAEEACSLSSPIFVEKAKVEVSEAKTVEQERQAFRSSQDQEACCKSKTDQGSEANALEEGDGSSEKLSVYGDDSSAEPYNDEHDFEF